MSPTEFQQLLRTAVAHLSAGRLAEAEQICARLHAQDLSNAEVLHLLGQIAGQSGRFAEAAGLISRAIALDPARLHYRMNLANCLTEIGRCDEAAALCEEIIAQRPGFAEAHCCLGNARADQGNHAGAIAAFENAVRLKPEFGEVFANLGLSLLALGRLDEAIGAYREGLRRTPRSPSLANNLAMALRECGEIDESLEWLRRSIEWDPRQPLARSNLVYFLLLRHGGDAARIREEMQSWSREHARPLREAIPRHGNNADPNRRLRVGFVSADFRDHVVGRALLPVFEHHDRTRHEFACYSNCSIADSVTERFRRCSSKWRDVAGLSDGQIAALIRSDGIDVLVDLSLHTSGNRLPVFARKPAPVQVSWLGYPGSTGLDTMDFRITDPHLDPKGAPLEDRNERALRLPHCWTPYAPPPESPPPGGLPALRRGAVTFASFNNFAKFNPRVFALWARIMARVAGSRLLLLSRGASSAVRLGFERHGIAPERIEFLKFRGTVPDGDAQSAFLARYQDVDIALDTFPYNGMTTTCDALWMGIPVVSLVGELPVSRAGLSLLANVGLGELAVSSEDEYVAAAVNLAEDLPRLAELRAALRGRMQKSALLDHARFTLDVEQALRGAWTQWCTGSASQRASGSEAEA